MKNLFLRILSIFIIIGIGIPTFGCENFNKQSQKDDFIGVDMKLPPDTVMKRDENNNTIQLLKGKNLSEGLEKNNAFSKLQSNNLFSKIALAFISANAHLFKINSPADELTDTSTNEDDLGFKHIRLQQKFNGIPVWASEINVHLNKHNQVYLIQGRYIPTPEQIDIHPVLKEDKIKRIVADNLKASEIEFADWKSENLIYSDFSDNTCLAYRIAVTLKATEGWAFIIDATTGDILEKLPTLHSN